MNDSVTIEIRAPETVAALANYIGNDGVVCLLRARLAAHNAEDFAGIDDAECFRLLLEDAYLSGTVSEFIDAKHAMQTEAAAQAVA